MDGRGGGETFGDVDGAGFVHRPDSPIAAACLPARMIKFPAVSVDILERGQFAVWRIEWHDQPTVARDARSVNADALARQIGMRRVGPHAARPDSFNGMGGSFAGAGRLGIARGLGLVHAASVSHFLGWGEGAPDISAPR